MVSNIYRIHDTDSATAETRNTIEFYCAQTNECNPYRKIRELGVVIYDNKGLQIDFCFQPDELEYLIKYLNDLNDHVKEFNLNSKPESNES